MEKIKLLIIVKSIDGGTGTFLINLLDIVKHYQDIKIKTLVLEEPTFRNTGKYHFDYMRKNNFYPQRYSLSPSNFLNFFKEVIWIRNKLQDFQPDAVLSIDLRCNLLAIILKKISGKTLKVIATNHIDLGKTIRDKSTKGAYYLLRYIIKLFYDQADIQIAVSRQLADDLFRTFSLKKRVITIYNGQKLHIGNPKNFPEEKQVVISIARLVEQKDHETLIKAFSIIVNQCHDISLWILSDGPEKQRLKRLTRELQLQSKIKFFGWVKDINYYLNKADIFVLSSKREGFAYVLTEAMSRGLPIIATNCPYGPSEVLANGKYGSLVPAGNENELAKAILTLLKIKRKYDYYAGQSIKRSKYFSLSNMLESYHKNILEITNHG